MTPHPDFPKVLRIMRSCPCEPLDRIVYRSVACAYARDDKLLTGKGSVKEGGRWNPSKSFRVIYASFDDHTALEESNAKFASYGFSKPKHESRTIIPLHVHLTRVVTLDVIASSIGISVLDLVTLDWRAAQNAGTEPLTQAIGRAAFALKIQALQSPSDRYPSGTNLTMLRKYVRVPKNIQILDPVP